MERCCLRAEAVGMEESIPQKSSISTPEEEEHCETRKEIGFLKEIFHTLLKSVSGWTEYCEILELTYPTANKNTSFSA